MGLLLGGSVLTVFELIDLIVFRFINTLFGKEKEVDETAEAAETGTAAAGRVQSPRVAEHPVSAVSTINTSQRRIRRIANYPPPTSPVSTTDKPPPPPRTGGRPTVVVQTKDSATPGGIVQH